ncbi:MAG: hypothetical protein OIF36_01615 [Alphaproteobacteria bacterium]|nr:hypothetical protein [Alphaproteobacteria bacterium]
MFRNCKKIFLLLTVAIFLASCSTGNVKHKTTAIKNNDPIKKVVKQTKKKYVPRKKYSRFKSPKKRSTSTTDKMLADLRGVVSNDVFTKLEKTQAKNPIKGYNSINKKKLKKVLKTATEYRKNITYESIKGLRDYEIEQILIPANKKKNSGDISLWEYKNNTCSAKVYFYKGMLAFIETKFEKKGFNDTNSCLKTFSL